MRGDKVAVVAIFHERCATGLVLSVREARHEHAARQRIYAVRSDCATRGLFEIIDGLYEARFGRVRVHVVDEDLAGIETGQPKLPPVIREAAVMRLIASTDRVTVNDLPVVR